MGWTKRQLVTQAFEELGYASYVYDLEPERLEAAMRRLDTMVAAWNGRGIRLGYPLPASPQDSDLDEETGVPDDAFEALITNLAVRLAPSIGKQPPIELKAAAATTYDLLLAKAAMPSEMQLPDTMPMGSGNKPWNYHQPFFPKPDDPLDAGPDGPLEFD